MAKDEMQEFAYRPVGSPSCSNQLHHVHYTFDFAQKLTIPHHSRQEGPLYFTSARRIQLFGVCMEGACEQYNYLIDEDCAIGMDGTRTHGPNTVLTLLHHALQNYGFGEMACTIHCDNCSGQNKNRFTIAYLCWRAIVGLHREFTLKLQISGHTKCLVDAGFSYIKKLYRRTDNDSIYDIVETVEKSAKTNHAVVVDGTIPWYDWKSFLSPVLKILPGIRKYHHFRFSALNPGVVFVKEKSSDTEKAYSVLKNITSDIFSPNRLPTVLPRAGLSQQRKEYLYRHVRPYVKGPAKDVTCPPPTEE